MNSNGVLSLKLCVCKVSLLVICHILFGSRLLALQTTSDELVDAALQAVRSNTDKLGAYSMQLHEKNESPNISPKSVVFSLPNGGELSFDSGGSGAISKFGILVGKSFFERQSYESNDRISVVWQFDGSRWNQFDVAKRVVVIRNPDQLPGMRTIDFQAVPSLGLSLEEFVRKSKSVQSKKLEVSEFGAGTIDLLLSNSKGRISELKFAANSRFLPIIYKELSRNGTVVFEQQFEYDVVPSRDAMVIRKIRSIFGVDPSDTNPQLLQLAMQGTVTLVVDQLTLLSDAEVQQSRMAWDRDWVVQDMTTWKPEMKTASSARRYLFWISLSIVVFSTWLFVLFRNKKLRSLF